MANESDSPTTTAPETNQPPQPAAPERAPVIVTPPLPEPLDPTKPDVQEPAREAEQQPQPLQSPHDEELAPHSDSAAEGQQPHRWQSPLSRLRKSG